MRIWANFKRETAFHVLFLVLTFVGIAWTYAPTLGYMPRADQWAFLVDTMDEEDFAGILAKSYSYSRTRKVAPGDTDLFRPMLFAVLALEKAWFGNTFVLWQALGIGLHCVVVGLTFLLLLQLGSLNCRERPNDRGTSLLPQARSFLVYTLVTFFAFNFSIQELVAWHHLHGYLLFVIFVVASFLALLRYADIAENVPGKGRAWLVSAWCLVLLAAFTYELGQLYAVVVGVFLVGLAACRGQLLPGLLQGLAFAGILLIFQGANIGDKLLHQGEFTPENPLPEILHHAWSADTLHHTARFLAFTILQPFFPAAPKWRVEAGRITLSEPSADILELSGWRSAVSLATAGMFLMLTLWGCLHLVRARRTRALLVCLVPLSLFALYTTVNVLGRMNQRPGTGILTGNSYYAYMNLLFFLIAAFISWQSIPQLTYLRWCNMEALPIVFLVAGLAVLSWLGSGRIHRITGRISDQERPFREQVQALEQFVKSHREEPNFSFTFDLPPDARIVICSGIPYPVVLYKRWLNHARPHYVLTLMPGKVVSQTARAFRERHPQRALPLLPEIVEIGAMYNYYAFGDWFYGVPCWDGFFVASRPEEDYAYLLKGKSLAKLHQREPECIVQCARDLGSGAFIWPGVLPETVEPLYEGYLLARAGQFFYAIPADEGPLERVKVNNRRYSSCLWASNLDALKARLRRRSSPFFGLLETSDYDRGAGH
jgi:hypothetical protein